MLRSTRGTESVNEIQQNGLVLGFVDSATYKELEESLRTGSRFLLYTDGLIEAANADDDLFGIERLKSTIAAGAGLPAQVVADDLLATIDAWSGRPPSDDLTVVLVDWVSDSSPVHHRSEADVVAGTTGVRRTTSAPGRRSP